MAKPKDELIDSTVSSSQCKLAIDALLKHALKHKSEQEKNELLPGKEQFIWLMLAVKKVHAEKKLKLYKIPLTHPLIDPRSTPICLITKDPQREYKDLLDSHNIKFISRVVGIQKLKGKFKPFEARRMLLKENGLFLADERVVPLLPKLLGKPFFNAKKQPIPVCLTRKELKSELEGAVSSTYFHQNQGTCCSIKIGTLGFHNSSQLLNNLKTALPTIAKNVKGGWTNIQSIHIKTNSSVSLPVWSCDLDGSKGGRWDGLMTMPTKDAKSDSDDEEEDEETNEEEELVAEVKKGKKRSAPTETTTAEPLKRKKKKHEGLARDKLSSKKTLSASTSTTIKPGASPYSPAPTNATPAATPTREMKPHPAATGLLTQSSTTPAASSSTVTSPVQQSSKKNKLKQTAEPVSKGPVIDSISTPTVASPGASLAKDKSKAKTKAIITGIDKKREKLISISAGKSKSGRTGKSVKDRLLGKKAAGQ